MVLRVTCRLLSVVFVLGGGLFSLEAAPSDTSIPGSVLPTDSLTDRAESIAQVRRDPDGDAVPDRVGDTVTVAGHVTAGQDELPLPIPNIAAVQDSTGGLHVLLPNGPTVERGDSLRVRGILEHQNGLAQLKGLDYETTEASARTPGPVPLTVSAAAHDRHEGRLVRIEGLVATKGENDGGKYLLLTDPGEEVPARISVFVANRHTSRLSLDSFEEGDEVEVTGVMGQYDFDPPYTDFYQLQPRSDGDLVPVGSIPAYLWWTVLGLGGGALLAVGGLVLLQATVRRRTRELRESQSRFRGLANSVPGVIFQFAAPSDDEYKFCFVGDQAEEMLGIPPDAENFFEQYVNQVPAPHREELLDSIDTAVDEGTDWRFEFPFEKPSGEQIWLLGISTAEQSEATQLFNGVFLDITERKRAEAKARLQTKVLQQIAEGTPLQDVLAELIEELEARRPSMLCSVLLYDPAENTIRHGAAPSLPHEYNRTVDGLDVGPNAGSCGTAIHTGSPVIAEDIETDPRWEGFREEALKHELRACWSVPIHDSEGKTLGSFAMYYREPKAPSDADWAVIEEARSLARIAITRHRDNKRLRLLTEAVEQSNDAILITEGAPLDPPGPRIEYVNSALEAMTGYSKDELIGRTPRVLQGPETDREVLDSLREALEKGEPWTGESVNYRRDGTPYRIRWSVAPVHDEYGTIEHWVSVQRDVTEERRRKQELKEAKEAAEEAARLKSAMLANMSHEIRTPLTSIIGFAEVLGDDEPREHSASDLAHLIEKSGRRLLNTLDTVLRLSKLEAGQMELSSDPVDVAAQLYDVAEQFEKQATEADLDLRTELSERSVRARCDSGGLQIVLQNLVSNAIKYSGVGGQVWLRAYETDEWTVLEIEDTGIGMNEDQIEELFEPFRQASEGKGRKYEGTGLGLAIAQETVEQMGGTIEVETEPGGGTCFFVRLPRVEPSDPTSDDASDTRTKMSGHS